MRLNEARELAQERSREGYVQHVDAHIIALYQGQKIVAHTVEPDGYYISNWQDSCTVASFANGREL